MEQKEVVINPFTGREIIVGGRTYKLVRSELLAWLEQQCTGREEELRLPGVYCGGKEVLPPNYLRHGTPYECLKKGFGTGKCSVYRKFRGI